MASEAIVAVKQACEASDWNFALIGAGAAIGGGIVSGVLSGIYEHLRDWWTRPKLHLDHKSNGDAYLTNATWSENGVGIECKYVRASLRNMGRREAKNCRVYAYSIEEIHNGKPHGAKFFDSMQLPWPHGDFSSRVIPASKVMTAYVDIVRFKNGVQGWDFRFGINLNSHERLKSHKGTYRVKLAATADNCKPAYCVIDIVYEGDSSKVRTS